MNSSGDSYVAYLWSAKSGFSAFGKYTGTGASLAITGLGFQPDLVITKPRDAAGDWYAYDSSRGITKQLEFGSDSAESTVAQSLKTFDSDGFTLGTDTSSNTNTTKYIYLAWKAAV